jgi:hypothetical protein
MFFIEAISLVAAVALVAGIPSLNTLSSPQKQIPSGIFREISVF